jgi:hypothetical protein
MSQFNTIPPSQARTALLDSYHLGHGTAVYVLYIYHKVSLPAAFFSGPSRH